MQEMLGVSQPDFGVLLDTMVVEPSPGVEAHGLIAPRVEPEIAFELSQPLEGDVGIDEVLAKTARLRPALEVIDSRVEGWRISIVDTVADNASSALVVLGEQSLAPDEIDLVAETASLTVGTETVEGVGAAVLGHPAAAVAWLAATLAEHGERLEAGEIVLPGAMTRALPFAPGDTVRCVFGSLGSLEVAIR
jgi:2-keto-4-pentenoate hydratase